ncbi:polysaccharide pyruvyl transferase family protein [Bacteroidales bacterium OttesenSCG-928-A17]|nr:polysaccharide pyruvyl transferase family protein [Bacteroidales bacterium OttesenSCG-928-A17]
MDKNRLVYRLRVSLPAFITGKVKKNLISAYWRYDHNNFGDLLTPLILKHYGLSPIHAYPHKAQLASVGTLLGFMDPDFKGYLLGTGIDKADTKEFPQATAIGLRGRLTQKALNLENRNDIVLGDPGLLISSIFPNRKEKKWKLGIIPHLSEVNHPILNEWKKKYKEEVKFINPLRNPEIVIGEIDECENIFSSSLHGLIIADSFEIPNCRFTTEGDHVYKYNDFRFEDYYSTLNVEGTKITVNGSESLEYILSNMRSDFSMLPLIKENLNKMFQCFASNFLKKEKQ